jgi:hypothetical protein
MENYIEIAMNTACNPTGIQIGYFPLYVLGVITVMTYPAHEQFFEWAYI